MHPIWLIELRGVLIGIFGIEVLVGGGEVGLVVDNWLLIVRLSRERISGWFCFVDVPVLLLFAVTALAVVVLELLCGCKSR